MSKRKCTWKQACVGLAGCALILILADASASAQLVTLNDGATHVVDFTTTDWYQVTNVGCTSFCSNPVQPPTHLTLNSGADIPGSVEIFGSSTITVNDGYPYDVDLWDWAHASVHGGQVSSVNLENYTGATITGGWSWFLRAHGFGSSTITGGEVDIVELADTHTLHMSGGESDGVFLNDSSSFVWSGGWISDRHGAGDNSHTQIVGTDFQVDFVRVGYGIIEASEGVLSGNLEEGNPFGTPDIVLLPDFKHSAEAPFTGTIELVAGNDDPDLDWLGSDAELNAGTDPDVYDTDGDGLGDGEEVGVHGSSPLLVDTDGDGFTDDVEVAAGSDPGDKDSIPPPVPSLPSMTPTGIVCLVLLLGLSFPVMRARGPAFPKLDPEERRRLLAESRSR
jgi:hypothetical protein